MDPEWNTTAGEAEVASSQKRRKRRPLNCWHCRIRKIKCDRGSPCAACLKSGDAATCSYIAQIQGKPDAPIQISAPGIEARINRLENLVRSVASSQNVSGGGIHALSPPDSTDGDEEEVTSMSNRMGSMKVDQESSRTYYLGPSHWVSVLSEVTELKNYISCEAQIIEKDAWEKYMYLSQAHVSLLRGLTPSPTKEELLTWSPPRLVADMAVNRFFASTSPQTALFHAPTFKEQCAQHWADPSKTPLAWLAMFYGLLYVSECSTEMDDYWTSGTAQSASETKNLYRMLTMKCLLASNYTRPRTYTLEAILLLLGGDYLTSSDAMDDTTLMLSMLVRSAIKMGLHRSYPHPDLTPYQREMRRRLWLMIHCMDVMHAAQVSLPPNIHQEDVDLTPPSNLYDSDFSPTSRTLPPSRPLTEITPITYYLLKYKHVLTLDRILKFTEAHHSPTREQMKPYEDALLETARSIPPRLQLDFAAEIVSETNLLRKERLQLSRLSNYNTCVLYRRFLTFAHNDQKLFAYRRSCIDAAMRILAAQDEIFSRPAHLTTSTSSPGMPPSLLKRHLLTITSVDFYTAGMAVAMDLYHGLKADPSVPKTTDVRIWGFDRRPEMMRVLERSTGYWEMAKTESVEAAKAWAVFGFVLGKCRDMLEGRDSGSEGRNGSPRRGDENGAWDGGSMWHDGTPKSLANEGVLDASGEVSAVPAFDIANGDFDWSFLEALQGFEDDAQGAFQW